MNKNVDCKPSTGIISFTLILFTVAVFVNMQLVMIVILWISTYNCLFISIFRNCYLSVNICKLCLVVPRDINLSISIVCLLNSMFEIYALSKTIANDTLFPVVIGVISQENIWAVSKDTDLVVCYHVEWEREIKFSTYLWERHFSFVYKSFVMIPSYRMEIKHV